MYKIHAPTVVDPASGDARPDHDIWIDGDRIQRIVPSSGPCRSGDLSGEGLFAIPGLIDTHVHALGVLVGHVPGLADLGWVRRQQLRNLRSFLHAGVTTVRDMAAPLRLVRRLARRAARRELVSPRLLYAGPMLTVPGGYPDFMPRLPQVLEWITGPVRLDLVDPAQAHAAVDRLAAAGVCAIKVGHQTARYDDERSPLPSLSREILGAVLGRARCHGIPVALHQIYRRDLLAVLDLPFDAIEHLPIDAPLSDEEAARVAARNVPISTTMMTYGIIDHLDELERLLDAPGERFEPMPLAHLRGALRAMQRGRTVSRHIGQRVIATGSTHMRATLARLRRAGATIVCGTDSGGAITPPGCPDWELRDMVRAGMSPLEALRSATSLAAAALGQPSLGRLGPGAVADVVLLGADPLADARAVADVRTVVQGGRVVHREPR